MFTLVPSGPGSPSGPSGPRGPCVTKRTLNIIQQRMRVQEYIYESWHQTLCNNTNNEVISLYSLLFGRGVSTLMLQLTTPTNIPGIS